MRIRIGGQSITLTDRDLLGTGGEARVYRWQDRAVKLWHAATVPAGSGAPAPGVSLSARVDRIRAFPRALPAAVIAPEELVLEAGSSQVVGFTMPLVTGGEDLRRLSSRAFREGVITNETVTALFRRLHEVLRAIHARRVVVGDLNGSNVLFAGTEVFCIDADSMQFDRFPCPVAHEWYLDPRLYGLDFAAGPAFSSSSDWYAFSVLFFSSLLYVHPYGGVHPGFPTLIKRAEARHSVMRADVKMPKAAVSPDTLPDALRDWFEAVFDRDHRGSFPEALLDLRWTRCGCGVTHARAACPACATAIPVSGRGAARSHGRCEARRLFTTTGRILCAAIQGTLRYLYEEGGVVYREDGEAVMRQPLEPGRRFALQGGSTWVAKGDRLLRVRMGQVLERTATGLFGQEPVFDASSSAAYRLDGEWLLEASTGMRLGRILPGQTWLRAGETGGFGFYRAGMLTVYFVFGSRRPGLRQVSLPAIEGRLLEAHAAFDDTHILFQVATEKGGRVMHRLFVLADDGRVLGRLEGEPDSTRALATLEGKAIHHGRVLCATDQGLLSLGVDPAGQVVERQLFVDTEPFVRSGATVLPGPGGSVYVVTDRDITQLVLLS